MKKALIIDPRSVNGSTLFSFTSGYISGLKKYYDIDFVSQYNCDLNDEDINHFKLFYKCARKIKNKKLRRLAMGVSYNRTYDAICKMVKKNEYDFVEIEWTLLLPMDLRNIKAIKKRSKVIVRAHNILPHSTDKKYYKKYKKIYDCADLIIVHGKKIKNEMCETFPEIDGNKIAVQLFGTHGVNDISYDADKVSDSVRDKIEKSAKVFLCVGRIDDDKGFDRVAKIWLENDLGNNLLVIAGGYQGKTLLQDYEKRIENRENILLLDGYVENNLLNYLFASADVVVLPYRNGSMSGVAFTAAQFSKTLVATDFGAMSEYLSEDCGWLCANDDESLNSVIINIAENVSEEQLIEKGRTFGEYVESTANWQNRVDKLYEEYLSKLSDGKR